MWSTKANDLEGLLKRAMLGQMMAPCKLEDILLNNFQDVAAACPPQQGFSSARSILNTTLNNPCGRCRSNAIPMMCLQAAFPHQLHDGFRNSLSCPVADTGTPRSSSVSSPGHQDGPLSPNGIPSARLGNNLRPNAGPKDQALKEREHGNLFAILTLARRCIERTETVNVICRGRGSLQQRRRRSRSRMDRFRAPKQGQLLGELFSLGGRRLGDILVGVGALKSSSRFFVER
ncbi:hypothetical protein GWK47_013607 [Chionoecetes opilio]|uniref:Uncharacterized protein n=1 Tax=Chionoecetes opilio TaxID=41210 RepID=A0A8J5CNU8_CHIOP|nr:hypothetical protein GWK47_013607 [Chionoecetes opilio]